MDSMIVTYAVADGVATVTLNRPEKMNAFSDEMVVALHDVIRRADADREVRVIVLTGAGRAFSAGGDVSGFGAISDPRAGLNRITRNFDVTVRPEFQTRHTYFPSLRKPVIAMINGATAGIALVYILCSDIRFASETAVFTTGFAKLGLSAEHGLSWLLARTIGTANSMDILLSSRKFHAPEALKMGLVNKVFAPDTLRDATMAYARDMALMCAPRSLRVIKQQVYEAPYQTFFDAIRAANEDLLVTNVSEDFKEGTRSFIEKRLPRFTTEA